MIKCPTEAKTVALFKNQFQAVINIIDANDTPWQ